MPKFVLRLACLLSIVALGLTAPARAQTAPAAQADGYKVALVTANRAGTVGDTELGALEDYITGKVTDLGVHVIAAETALNAVGSMEPGARKARLDAEMAQATSAVRLAQTLGADYLLQVTLTGFDSATRKIDAYGVQATNEERTARLTYKILDGQTGASLAADTVSVTKVHQQTAAATVQTSSVVNALLEEAAAKIAASLQRAIARGRLAAAAAPALVDVTIRVSTAEPVLLAGTGQTAPATGATSFSVRADGLAIGNAPGTIKLRPGLTRLQISHPDYRPWEGQVMVQAGLVVDAVLERTPDSRAEQQQTAAIATGLGFFDKHLGRFMIAGTLVLISFAAALGFRAYRRRGKSTTEISIKNQQD